MTPYTLQHITIQPSSLRAPWAPRASADTSLPPTPSVYFRFRCCAATVVQILPATPRSRVSCRRLRLVAPSSVTGSLPRPSLPVPLLRDGCAIGIKPRPGSDLTPTRNPSTPGSKHFSTAVDSGRILTGCGGWNDCSRRAVARVCGGCNGPTQPQPAGNVPSPCILGLALGLYGHRPYRLGVTVGSGEQSSNRASRIVQR